MRRQFAAALVLLATAMSARAIDLARPLTVSQFRNTTNKGDYAWLGVALADMVGNDLASLKKLPIVTREQLGAVLAEQQLQLSSIVDEKTAAKAGSIVGAGYILLGDFIVPTPAAIRINVNVIEVDTGKSAAAASITGDPADVFTLEKLLVARTLESLGVVLGESEKVRLFQIPTTSVAALEQNFRGVIALERNDKGAAKDYFESAVKADPYYREAKTNLDKASVTFAGGGLFANAAAELGDKNAQMGAVKEFRDWYLKNALEFRITGSPRIAATNPEKRTADIAVDWKADFRQDSTQRLVDFAVGNAASGWKGDENAAFTILPPRRKVAEKYAFTWYKEAGQQWYNRSAGIMYVVSFSLLAADGTEVAVSKRGVALTSETTYGDGSTLKYNNSPSLGNLYSYQSKDAAPVTFTGLPQADLERLKEIKVRSILVRSLVDGKWIETSF